MLLQRDFTVTTPYGHQTGCQHANFPIVKELARPHYKYNMTHRRRATQSLSLTTKPSASLYGRAFSYRRLNFTISEFVPREFECGRIDCHSCSRRVKLEGTNGLDSRLRWSYRWSRGLFKMDLGSWRLDSFAESVRERAS